MAKAFLKVAVEMVFLQTRQRNFKVKFFQSLLLFFVLLRYRKLDQGFVNPENPFDRELLDRLFWCLDRAEEWFVKYWPHRVERVERVRQICVGVKNYMKYEGYPGIIHLLTEMAEEG